MHWVESLSPCVLEQGMLKQYPNQSAFKNHMISARNKLVLFEDIEVWLRWVGLRLLASSTAHNLLSWAFFCVTEVGETAHSYATSNMKQVYYLQMSRRGQPNPKTSDEPVSERVLIRLGFCHHDVTNCYWVLCAATSSSLCVSPKQPPFKQKVLSCLLTAF